MSAERAPGGLTRYGDHRARHPPSVNSSTSRAWGTRPSSTKRRLSSTKARFSRRFTKKSTACSAALHSAPWSAITNSASTPKTWPCWKACRTSPRRLTRHSSVRRVPTCSISRATPRSMRPATWPRSSTRPNMRSGNRSGRAKIRAMWRSPCRGLWAACLTAPRPSPWTSSVTKSTSTAPTTPSTFG